MSTSKTTQKRLNLLEKSQILKKVDNGVSGKRLALEYGVSTAAISKIKKKREEILAAVAKSCDDVQRKTLHNPEFIDLEKNLYEWFIKQRERNCAVNGTMIKAKAKVEFKKLYPQKEFTASDGWLAKFRKRYGIRYLKISGEILSSDISDITEFINILWSKIDEMGITDMQLYNADESGLYYRMLPDKTYVAATEKTAPGRKSSKERVTILLCANADGSHKLNPLVIGKSANPRSFKGFDNPLEYASSTKAWMNSQLFYEWFHKSFTKQVRKFSSANNLSPKALLLVDNCTAHKPIELLKSNDGNIIAMLLPPNVTAVIQPMDQNPIRLVKLGYRTKLLCNILAQESLPIEALLKKHTICDAILLLKTVWDELPQSVLKKAWAKIKNWGDDQYESDDDIPLAQIANDGNKSFEEVKFLLTKVSNAQINDEDIVNWNADLEDDEIAIISDTDNDTDTDLDEIADESKVTYTEAVASANKLIEYFKYRKDANQVVNLIDVRTIIVKNYLTEQKKQTTIQNYFLQA